MFILDDLLLSPLYGTLWVGRQVDNAIQQERAEAPERITADLGELYMMLETGRITEGEFAAREKELLDQLDQLEERKAGADESQEAKDQPEQPENADRELPTDAEK